MSKVPEAIPNDDALTHGKSLRLISVNAPTAPRKRPVETSLLTLQYPNILHLQILEIHSHGHLNLLLGEGAVNGLGDILFCEFDDVFIVRDVIRDYC